MSSFSRLHMLLKEESAAIPGESVDKDFKGQIQLSSVKWSLKRKSKKGATSSGDRGRPEPGVLELSKNMDKSSTTMLGKLKYGIKLNAVITLASIESSDFELKITVSNIRIVEYKISAKDGEKIGEVSEDWTFNYDTIRFEHAPGDDNATLTSTHKRSPDASVEGTGGVKKLVSDYGSLNASDKKSAVSEFKTGTYKDDFK